MGTGKCCISRTADHEQDWQPPGCVYSAVTDVHTRMYGRELEIDGFGGRGVGRDG